MINSEKTDTQQQTTIDEIIAHCVVCGKTCGYVGQSNRVGEQKALCCVCYEKSWHKKKYNPTFSKKDYCSTCKKRV